MEAEDVPVRSKIQIHNSETQLTKKKFWGRFVLIVFVKNMLVLKKIMFI